MDGGLSNLLRRFAISQNCNIIKYYNRFLRNSLIAEQRKKSLSGVKLLTTKA